MTDKVEIKSNFLEKYLSDSNQIHFLGNNNESSLYIKVENSDNLKDADLFFWVEFEQTNSAPIIILYLNVNTDEEEFVFDFIYDIKEEADIDELNNIIDEAELDINVLEFELDKLFFAFKYKLELDKSFVEELKRLIFQAQEYSRTMIDEYDIDAAIDDFLDGKSIFNSKTNTVDDFKVLFPQKVEKEEEESERNFFTYTSKTSGDFHDDGDSLQVKVYKRDEYEKLKGGLSNSKTSKNENINSLKGRIRQLELIISGKNKEIEQLKTENTHLKEELEYQKLDTPKKGWKLF
jgi:hypothetical protein